MSAPSGAPLLEDDDPAAEALMQMVFKLTTVAAAMMLCTSETGTLIETGSFQVLLTTEFKLRKTEKGRGVKFDGLLETEEGKVITFGLIVPCEEAIFTRRDASVARTH
jgi:hypothetical protein